MIRRYGATWKRGLVRRTKEKLIETCAMLAKQMLQREAEVEKLKKELKEARK